MHNRIIAFAGPKGCGKSTASRHLIEKHGFVRFSFADPIREMLEVIGVTREQMSDPVLKESPCDILMGKSPRWAMQSLGTQWGRDLISQGIWVSIAQRRLEKAKRASVPVVLDDCRFDNEAEAWRAAGGVVFEIQRDGCNYNSAHASEAGVSRHLLSGLIHNNRLEQIFLNDIDFVFNLTK